MIKIAKEMCVGCGKCVEACFTGALSMGEGVVKLDEERCSVCGVCVSACPVGAIESEMKAQVVDVSEYEDIWVFMERENGKLKLVGPQLLSIGGRLADKLGGKLCAVLLGNDIGGDPCNKCASFGAERIYVVDNEVLDTYSTEGYTSALSVLITKYKPNVLLIGATHLGRDLAPSVAANLGLGLTADCTGLSIEEKEGRKLLLQTRPAFGGNVMADIVCPNTRPQMATVRPNVFETQPKIEREAEIIKEDVKIDPNIIRTKILETIRGRGQGEVGLEDADIIVSGGRGVGSPENFVILDELAEKLGGVVGCSRPIVEKGWMPKSRQVGQSGKTVSPKLYIACGISGSVQHKVGIRDSDFIVAINKDPEAPIFELADLSIVGDLHKVVPRLIKII